MRTTAITTYTIFRDTQNRDAPGAGPFIVRCESQQSIISAPVTPGQLMTVNPKPPNASSNLLGRKFVKTNIDENKASAGVYLYEADQTNGGKRNITVK